MNTHYPGLPDYTGPTQGWFLLTHHDIALEWSDDIRERVRYIETDKPQAEREIRLRCLYAIEASRVPLACAQAWAACEQTCAAYAQAWAAYEQAWAACAPHTAHAYEPACAVCAQAKAAYEQAWAAYAQAKAAYAQAKAAYAQAKAAYAPELTALIRVCVPDAPWDGTQLVWAAQAEKENHT